MSEHADSELGVHQARRRLLVLAAGDIQVVNVNIAAAGVATSGILYAPGFTHFTGIVVTNTPVVTTLVVRVRPGEPPATFLNDDFTVATLVTLVGLNRYSFYWGEARGLLTGALGTGATFCFSTIFRLVLTNTGANPANLTTVEQVECS